MIDFLLRTGDGAVASRVQTLKLFILLKLSPLERELNRTFAQGWSQLRTLLRREAPAMIVRTAIVQDTVSWLKPVRAYELEPLEAAFVSSGAQSLSFGEGLQDAVAMARAAQAETRRPRVIVIGITNSGPIKGATNLQALRQQIRFLRHYGGRVFLTATLPSQAALEFTTFSADIGLSELEATPFVRASNASSSLETTNLAASLSVMTTALAGALRDHA